MHKYEKILKITLVPVILILLFVAYQFFANDISSGEIYRYKFLGTYFSIKYIQIFRIISSLSMGLAMLLAIYVLFIDKVKRNIFYLVFTPIFLQYFIVALLTSREDGLNFSFGIQGEKLGGYFYAVYLLIIAYVQILLFLKRKNFSKSMLLPIFVVSLALIVAFINNTMSCNIFTPGNMFCGFSIFGFIISSAIIVAINLIWFIISSIIYIKKRNTKVI
jgi:hypothetical protein